MTSTDSILQHLDEVDEYAGMMPTPVTLRELYDFARNPTQETYIKASQFLYREMPIRLAVKVKELETAPDGLNEMRSIQMVRDWYVQSFWDIRNFGLPKTLEDDKNFIRLLASIKDRHRNQVAVMSQGIFEFKERRRHVNLDRVQRFLDSFYMSRIGIRVLLGQHVALHRHRDGWSGIINARCSPMEVAEQAIRNASDLCRQTFGDPPEVKILGRTSLRFKYIPTHLHHMFIELLKNSFRAVIETHGKNGGKLPPVTLVIAGGSEDVSIRISDEGGGIPRSGIDKIWTYMYTTANHPIHVASGDQAIMAGLGYGLPLARLYARYFSGDLQVISLEGYGTDAFIYLSRIGNQQEALK